MWKNVVRVWTSSDMIVTGGNLNILRKTCPSTTLTEEGSHAEWCNLLKNFVICVERLRKAKKRLSRIVGA
jgi:hypothetical protein